MKCDKCYFENPENETYCINCGEKLPKKPLKKEKQQSNQKPITYITIKPSHFNNILNHKEDDYYLAYYKEPDDNIYPANQNNKSMIIWIIVFILILLITISEFLFE